MEFDKRIIHPTDNIWSSFGATSEQDIYVGLEGYFTDCYSAFANLNNCHYGTLETIDLDSNYPFEAVFEVGNKKSTGQFAFFLPARDVKPKEKKYRPFANTEEFFEKTGFEAGDVIHVRSKGDGTEYHLMLVGWAEDTLMLGNLSRLNFKELFKWFELWDGEDKFIPFGVEE